MPVIICPVTLCNCRVYSNYSGNVIKSPSLHFCTGTVYYHPSSTYTTAFKKKKPIYSYGKRRRRRRSNADETWDEYPPNMSLENNSDLDMMYNGLISAIGAYVNVTYAPA